ncbi:unnamed protein product, partial [Laminaria digitata]
RANHAGCLNLVTNAVIPWNPAYMNAAVCTLKNEGLITEDTDLSHLSPGTSAHVCPFG